MVGSGPRLSDELHARIAVWRDQDPDAATVTALDDLALRAEAGDDAATAEVLDAFDGRLTFGTAGLRGALGPGPNRMNRVVVGQAAAGLAAYLRDRGLAGPVIIGYDARHNSEVFARDTAEILAGAGFDALLTAGPLPTPVVAFGIRHLDCVAGVVVTASHNPPQDNGYKVYLGDGSQIVPPADAEIAARIDTVAAAPLTDVIRSAAYTVLGEELLEAYVDRIVTLVPTDAPRDVTWVYTPLHGVGGRVVDALIERIGFASMVAVAEQATPDPDFPTVAFPNPEEPGAIDLALALAGRTGADLVVANDPDADRCAAAVIVDGTWRMLRGDELGALLGDDALRRGVQGTYACSLVSSSLLETMAEAHGQPFTYTLTGFKWIGRVPGLAFGYEEAIGYCVDPEAVPDKDGISALVRVLVLAAGLKAQGSSLSVRLDEIARTYGVNETGQLSFRVEDLTVISDAMARLRAHPPTTLIGETVTVDDLADGWNGLPPTDGMRIAGASVTVTIRPSGTEPKLKCYLESRLDPSDSKDLTTARARARSALQAVRAEVSGWLEIG